VSSAASVRWDCEETHRLSQLEGIWADLCDTSDFLRAAHVRATSAASLENLILLDALVSAALVRYSRCFVSGRRLKLTHAIDLDLSDELSERHELVRGLRDRHVAHPVAELETNSTDIWYQVHADEFRITSVSSSTRTNVPLSPLDIERFLALCNFVESRIRAEMEKESARLVAIARAMPKAEFQRLPIGPREPSNDPRRTRMFFK
jgi:hypothetical protein